MFFSDSLTGITLWTIILSCLECLTVVLFLLGCIYYLKITKKIGTKLGCVSALIATVLSFVGAFPNALDKISKTLFSYDLWFDSSWLFFFIGISYVLLFISSLTLGKNSKNNSIELLAVFPTFQKYISMTMASIGMFGFYTRMFLFTRKTIGKASLLYFVTFLTTIFLIVFFCCW